MPMKVPAGAMIALTAALSVAVPVVPAQAAKPRTIVTTDVETDDYNSLIRYLLYTNEIDTVGFVYSSSHFHWAGDSKGSSFKAQDGKMHTSWRWTGTHAIQDLIGEYRKAYSNLKVHDPAYPSADRLLSLVKIGNIQFEGDMANDTEGSNWIRKTLLDTVPGPLYLQAWGGTNTIARALKSIEDEYRGQSGWNKLYRRISKKAVIYSWGKQDNTYDDYIAKHWPNIQFNDISRNAWGYWLHGAASTNVLPEDKPLFEPAWTISNVLNVGPLGAKYRVWADGRTFVGDQEDTFGMVPYPGHPLREAFPFGSFISEGDTPAFLNLIANGLRSYESPGYGGWGDRLVRSTEAPTNYWQAVTDEKGPGGQAIDNYTSKRWVAFAQQDFASRLRWTITPTFSGANHAPVPHVGGPLHRKAKPGEIVVLNGSATDPDHNRTTQRWWQYVEAGSYPGPVHLKP